MQKKIIHNNNYIIKDYLLNKENISFLQFIFCFKHSQELCFICSRLYRSLLKLHVLHESFSKLILNFVCPQKMFAFERRIDMFFSCKVVKLHGA